MVSRARRTLDGKSRTLVLWLFVVVCLAGLLALPAHARRDEHAVSPAFVGQVDVSTTFTTATFSLTTNVPTLLSIGTGTDTKYLLETADQRRTRHTVTVRGLAPNTPYYALVRATDAARRTIKTWRRFETAAPGSAAAIVTNRLGRLLLNGQPWFMMAAPVGTGCPASEVILGLKGLGVQVLSRESGFGCLRDNGDLTSDTAAWAEFLHGALGNKLFWLEHGPSYDVHSRPDSFPELLAWRLPLREFPIVPTFGESCDQRGRGEPVIFDQVKKASARAPAIYQGLALRRWLSTPNQKNCLTSTGLARIFWLTVAAGGDGFEVVAQDDVQDGNGTIDVSPDIRDQAALEARQLATLGPCILAGDPLPVRLDGKSGIRAAAWKYGTSTCIIAVNTRDNPVSTSLSLTALRRATTAKIFWNNRDLRISSAGGVTISLPATGVALVVAK